MSCITSHAARVEMIERHLAGESLATIAQAMQLNLFTVRKFCDAIATRAGRVCLPVRLPHPEAGRWPRHPSGSSCGCCGSSAAIAAGASTSCGSN